MANYLKTEKKITIIGALAEGCSIRSVECMTDVHRDTIIRLGVRTGEACKKILDETMRDLPCQNLQLDEIWGFIGKKQKNVYVGDLDGTGSVWTFVAIDADTKVVPCFAVGKRDATTANAFLDDLASRLIERPQISTDGLPAYIEAVEQAFGSQIDYGQIIKTYSTKDIITESRYSPAEIVSVEKGTITGSPETHLNFIY